MSLVVHVIAPTGRDGELITGVLQSHGIPAELGRIANFAFADWERNPPGPLLIAEEALRAPFVTQLGDWLRTQPHWSDLPVLMLTGSKDGPSYYRPSSNGHEVLGSPVLLERPIRTATLISSVQAALRARARQFETREAFRERDDALAELKRERETLQVMLDNLPTGVLLVNAAGEVVLGNRRLELLLRHPLGANLERSTAGIPGALHPDGTQIKREEYPLIRAMAAGHPIPAEDFLYQRGDGTRAWVSLAAAPILDEHGTVTGGVGAVSDIDHQKRADADLRRSEERFRRLIENASVGVLIGGFDGSISYANPYLLNLLEYDVEYVERGLLRWDELTSPEFAESDRKAVEQLRATGTADPYQKAFRSKSGRAIPLLVGATLIPSHHEDDTRDEVAVFLTDLSSQKQAESALIQSEKLAAVGRLAASISHEINNPLEAVTNLLYLARQDNQPVDEVQGYLEQADQELGRVSQIVSHTLRFHRQSTRPRAITAAELLEPTLGLYQGRFVNSGIELVVQHRFSPEVTCYEGEIRQVLNNLIGNAIESMRTGGRLVVRTRGSCLWRDGVPGLRITVADTGHGMPVAVLERVFEAFYTTKGINGTGLGLWISRGIVDKHQGLLQVHSTSQGTRTGTVFSLFLPSNPFNILRSSLS